MVTIALGVLILSAQTAAARQPGSSGDPLRTDPPKLRGGVAATTVPLPKPRPARAPPRAQPLATDKQTPPATEKPAGQEGAPAAPQPSACRLALTDEIAIAPSIPDIRGPGGCGGEDLVRLEAIILPDKSRVAVKPAATLRCSMASAIADWVRSDVAALAQGLASPIVELDNFDSFECRGRNRVAGAVLSEHGRANALDVRAFKLENGRSVGLTDRAVVREVRESVLHSACARFTTVLGPGSDWYHEDHIHLDLAQRRNGYRICEWDVWDPLPQIAPLLPAERPAQAPPREVATGSDAEKADVDKSGAERPEAAQADKPEAKTGDVKPSTKKRRQGRRF